MGSMYVIPSDLKPPKSVIKKLEKFLDQFRTYEILNGSTVILYHDLRSQSYYILCHLDSSTLVSNSDLEASLDSSSESEEDIIFKLNRDITEDEGAFKQMVLDAKNGRSFEDMVIEFDTSYRKNKPLKIYGGQHRIRAIQIAAEDKVSYPQGVRVYFNLTRDQKVEIASINNTSIAVPNDLIDRMKEQLLGSELRDWSHKVGLLDNDEDFADRRNNMIPTVRIARTLLVNFYKGKTADFDSFHQPILCKSGGMDEDYFDLRKTIKWDDPGLVEMGRQFDRLHKIQRKTVNDRDENRYAEYARKALSYSVVASWAYAAGLFQKHNDYLNNHYAIPDSQKPPLDPLNAKALSEARMKGTDPDTYRGLGTRTSSNELGRMLEVFLVQACKASSRGINKKLANAAIQSYEAKKVKLQADKALKKI